MKKILSATIATLAILSASYSFGSTSHSPNCSFPHHFTVSGPATTYISKIEREDYPANNITVTNATNNSFDITRLDSQTCYGGAFHLVVSKDNKDSVDLIVVDSNEQVTLISATSFNNFKLKEIREETRPNIEIIFE